MWSISSQQTYEQVKTFRNFDQTCSQCSLDHRYYFPDSRCKTCMITRKDLIQHSYGGNNKKTEILQSLCATAALNKVPKTLFLCVSSSLFFSPLRKNFTLLWNICVLCGLPYPLLLYIACASVHPKIKHFCTPCALLWCNTKNACFTLTCRSWCLSSNTYF